ncbi:MAG: OsmC family peroxiredoxin [Actinobacteria bacterium]|nr:OsmC family peroxiredoxin [Actinomycetota bacterium]
MPRIERSAQVLWEGNLARGTGHVSGDTGAFAELPISLPSRIGKPDGKTSPEELLAAAHAGCLATSVAGELSRAGTPPEMLALTARVIMDEVEGKGHLIVGSEVDVHGRVPGIDAEAFARIVAVADAGCSFSTLIRASATVTVRAHLNR